jgi:hypothetical protein
MAVSTDTDQPERSVWPVEVGERSPALHLPGTLDLRRNAVGRLRAYLQTPLVRVTDTVRLFCEGNGGSEHCWEIGIAPVRPSEFVIFHI